MLCIFFFQIAGWSVFLLYLAMTIISMVRCRRGAKSRRAINGDSGFEQSYPPEMPYASPHGQLKMMEDESEEQSPFQ